ncbi:MAG: IS91 family transposase [Tannerella sp.]|jgi:hypothetical protein|nr:IS91 family transposase [Tannerella sp.]
MRPQTEVGCILRGLGERIESIGLNTFQLRTLSALRRCRTAELGGHVDACTECGVVRISYNSCRNRHCPKCQGNKREKWIQARNAELLPVPYFHVVFTLPEELNICALHHPKEVYGILFKSAWETLCRFGKNKGVTLGMISVLHTWGQTLGLHPHLHCIVPGGGMDKNGKWRNIRVDGKFLFPVKALGKVFRAKYVSLLREAEIASQDEIAPLFSKRWVVYAKRPFAHPSHVVEYLGRYTHKVAISNHRLISCQNNRVSFSYKDYRHGGVKKVMELDDTEFIRRFALHILPAGFVRIRHFGFLSSTSKKVTIPSIREQFPSIEICFIDMRKTKPFDPKICPCCGTPTMITIETIPARGPPQLTNDKKLDMQQCFIA